MTLVEFSCDASLPGGKCEFNELFASLFEDFATFIALDSLVSILMILSGAETSCYGFSYDTPFDPARS